MATNTNTMDKITIHQKKIKRKKIKEILSMKSKTEKVKELLKVEEIEKITA